jgi:integrase
MDNAKGKTLSAEIVRGHVPQPLVLWTAAPLPLKGILSRPQNASPNSLPSRNHPAHFRDGSDRASRCSSNNQRYALKLVKKYLKRADISKKASVHTLRHTFGTHKVDRGMTLPALQELLRHKKMETTYKYVHLAKTTLRQQQETTAL